MHKPKKILVIRNDKIGDFMLAWPAFALLKSQHPKAEITALVPQYTAPLAEQCEWIDKVLIDTRKVSFFNDVRLLSKNIKLNNYDLSISLFSELRTAIALWLAGVQTRIGPATKIAQIFLNRTLKQKRSQSTKPEYEYNLDLIQYYIKLDNKVPIPTKEPPFWVFNKEVTQLIRNNILNEHSIEAATKLIIIHPGSGGSAINLPIEKYAELANCIARHENVYFIITAGPNELSHAKYLSEQLEARHHIHDSKNDIIGLCKLIGSVDVFISGSTGPLHIAGALNTFTVAFYPSKTSATSLRWQTLNEAKKRLAFTLNSHTADEVLEINIKPVCEKICTRYFKNLNSTP